MRDPPGGDEPRLLLAELLLAMKLDDATSRRKSWSLGLGPALSIAAGYCGGRELTCDLGPRWKRWCIPTGSYWQLIARIGEAAVRGPARSFLDDPEHESPEEDGDFWAEPSFTEAPPAPFSEEEAADDEPEPELGNGAKSEGDVGRPAVARPRKPARAVCGDFCATCSKS